MSEQVWSAVDGYLDGLYVGHDPALDGALRAAEEAGLPPIQVSPTQGKLLHLLARLQRAERILELGTLAGYSAIWLARALPPDGRLVTLEVDPFYAEVARSNLERAGLGELIALEVGPALETLPRLAAEGAGPFDLVFIDADKPAYADYLPWAIELSRPGGLIVADNVIRAGAVADASGGDPRAEGARRFHALLAAEPRLDATTIQTVGGKGHDGFALAIVSERGGPEAP